MGVKQGQKRWWKAGRKKITNGDLVSYTLRLTERQVAFLHEHRPNASALLRALLDAEIDRRERKDKGK